MSQNKPDKTDKTQLSLQPYKGTRDFYPEDMRVRNYIFSVMRKVCESFGYQEYDASVLEETALYKAKSGDEIVNQQTYSFTDRGGREVTIRPEMTPTVARMVAQKRGELPYPLRWYSIPNLFRYERPQRGRLREHWQLNADIFGVNSIQADLESVHLAYRIMKAFGSEDSHFEIRINHRKLVNGFLREILELDDEKALAVSKLIDRREKMELEKFSALVSEQIGDKFQQLEGFLGATNLNLLVDDLREKSQSSAKAALELESSIANLQRLGVLNATFHPGLMRGFDYYTGLVFEVFDKHPDNNRSLFGGGRYDDLVGIFNVPSVCGVGFGMGDVTIRDFLETHHLMPKLNPPAALCLCLMDETVAGFANLLAVELRKQNVNVTVDFTGRKVGQQIKAADKQGVPFIIVIGDQEARSGNFKLKHLASGKEVEVDRGAISEAISVFSEK